MSGDFVHFDPGNAGLGDAPILGVTGQGWQSLSTLYEYRVLIEVGVEGGLDDDALDELLRNPVRVAFGAAMDSEVHGVVRDLEMLSTRPNESTQYWLTIVPKLYYLTLTRHTRVFQEASHLDIVKSVLEEHGLAAESHYLDRCNGRYAPQEYTVQYQETDFDFVSRLLEYNGVHYHFIQEPDGEVLVLGDDNKAFQAVPGFEEMTYDATSSRPDEDEPYVTTLRRFRRPRAARVVVREYNWRTPTTTLRFEHAVDERTGHGSLDFFGEHFKNDGDGQQIARLRAEEHRVAGDVVSGQTASRRLRPGARFRLTGHPNPDLDREYVVTAVEESIALGEGGAYAKRFEAIPETVPYRPARRVAWPKVDGIVNAKVDGEARSTATPIDEQGRYKVVLPLDERGTTGGRASRWVRAAQPSAGGAYGFHFPLHIGTEVVIGHVNGDPDRPIIVGAVPNAETESPVVRDNATHSRMRTGSGIVIELDDDC